MGLRKVDSAKFFHGKKPGTTETYGNPYTIHVAGAGAPAGWLDALERPHVNPHCGMVLVIAQNLDSTHKVLWLRYS